MPARAYRPLLVVLLDLAALKPGLVLLKGKDYWRIEDIAKLARREAKSGPPQTQLFLNEPMFFWMNGPDKKVIIMQMYDDQDVPFAVEPGSEISVPL